MNTTTQYKSFRLTKAFGKGMLIALLLSFLTTGTINAQPTADEVRFENIESYVQNGSLHVSFDLKLQGKFLSSGDALHIHPVYRTESGELALPGILVNGKQRARFYRREQSLLSKSERMANKPFAVIEHKDKETQRVAYNYILPIPEGVSKRGTLHIEQQLQDCCDLVLLDSQSLPLDYRFMSPDPSIFANTLTYITPEVEQVKKRDEKFVIRIDYPVNRHEVLPNFADNKAELERMDKEMRSLFSDKDTYKIEGAVIKGYASPEDTYEHNLNLSRRRTDTFKKYLVNKYGLTGLNDFPAQGMGEDWEGLRKAVVASNMEYKDEVLNIIDTEGIFDGREKKLMELAGGKPYNYMLKELYPPLRRMEMEINYTVRPFDSTEIESVIQERPKGLSQLEMFHYIQKTNNNDLFLIAADYFPNSVSANVNASSVALYKGDLELAWTYLSKVEDNPEAYNNLGIYYCLKGDVERAKDYFQNAMAIDSQKVNAVANMMLLEKY